MVKGTSRQVIVVQAPDPKLFEQAIFILKDKAVEEGVTEEALLKEARNAIRGFDHSRKKGARYMYGAVWAGGGAAIMGLVWLATILL